MVNISNKFLNSIYKLDSFIQEKYNNLYIPEKDALCSSIAGAGVFGGLYFSSVMPGWWGVATISFGLCSVIYLDRERMLNDVKYNMLLTEMGSYNH